MDANFTNGASVARAYANEDASDTELLAVFQYETDAIAFARSKLADDAARKWTGGFYVVSNHYSAKVQIFRHQTPKAGVPAS